MAFVFKEVSFKKISDQGAESKSVKDQSITDCSSLNAKDYQNVYEVFLACATAVENKAFFNWSSAAIKEELQVAKCFVLLKDQMKTKAFITFRDSVDVWEITALGTDPAARGQGLMSRLLREFILKYCNASKSIQVEVHSSNEAAIRLYSKLGFKTIRTRRSYYPDGADALVMMYLIS